MDLYYQMFGDLERERDDSTDILGQWNPVPHRLHLRGFHNLDEAFDYGIRFVYWGVCLPEHPVFDGTLSQLERNARFRDAYLAGTSVPDLVQEFQISPQRVYQILRGD